MTAQVECQPISLVSPSASPFDALAAGYDRSFTHSRIGQRMRQAVWQRLDVHFRPGDHLLELNCGTGEDALYLAKKGVHVLATDVSAAMVATAQAKVEQAGLKSLVDVRHLSIEEIASIPLPGSSALQDRTATQASQHPISGIPCPPPVRGHGNTQYLYDGALSNFGGLNCVSDLNAVSEGLAACLRPGAIALLCLMGPVCLWEWAWYLGKGQPTKAFRRLRRSGITWRGLTIHYPSIRAVRCAFAPAFKMRRVSAIGALLPPTYAENWAARHERLLAQLDRLERRWETLPPLPSLADHYLLEMERR